MIYDSILYVQYLYDSAQVCDTHVPQCMSYHKAIGGLVITGMAHCLSFWLNLHIMYIIYIVYIVYSIYILHIL